MLNLSRTRLVPSWRISMRNLFITTEGTPNPNALKFLPGRDVLGSGKTCDFPDIRDAYKVMCFRRHNLELKVLKLKLLVTVGRGLFYDGFFVTGSLFCIIGVLKLRK